MKPENLAQALRALDDDWPLTATPQDRLVQGRRARTRHRLLLAGASVLSAGAVIAALTLLVPEAGDTTVTTTPPAAAPREARTSSADPSTPQPPSDSASTDLTKAVPISVTLPSGATGAVNAPLRLSADGALLLPENGRSLAWFGDGAVPGAPSGTVLIAGRRNTHTQLGFFAQLESVRRGDLIQVTAAGGRRLTYAVTSKQKYLPTALPKALFGAHGRAQLALLTETGVYNLKEHAYEQSLVVLAEPTTT